MNCQKVLLVPWFAKLRIFWLKIISNKVIITNLINLDKEVCEVNCCFLCLNNEYCYAFVGSIIFWESIAITTSRQRNSYTILNMWCKKRLGVFFSKKTIATTKATTTIANVKQLWTQKNVSRVCFELGNIRCQNT